MSTIPSRASVLEWEAERYQIMEQIRAANRRLEQLQIKIERAWTARTPALGHDVMELIFDCFEPPQSLERAVAEDEDEDARLRDLASLARVSTHWYHSSSKRLFHNISFVHSHSRSELIVMSVLQNSESRRRLVRRLEVDASNGDWRSCRQLRLPNLSQLLVYGWPRHHVEPKAYYGLLTSSTHLQEVIIQGAHVKGLGGILARWSNLSSLAIREPVDRAIPRMSDDHVPFSALTSLEYTWADLRTGLLPRIAPNTLRSLKLDHVYFYIPNPLSHLLETVLAGHPIEYLKIANCERKRHRHEPIPSIAHLSSLMHLEFYDNDFSFADPATQIPLTLNKLSLSYAWGSPAQILELAQKMTPEPNDARKRHFCISGIARIHDPEWGGVCKQVSALGIFLELSEGALEKDRMFGDSMEYSTDDEGLDNLKSSDSESEGHSSGDDEMTVPVLW